MLGERLSLRVVARRADLMPTCRTNAFMASEVSLSARSQYGDQAVTELAGWAPNHVTGNYRNHIIGKSMLPLCPKGPLQPVKGLQGGDGWELKWPCHYIKICNKRHNCRRVWILFLLRALLGTSAPFLGNATPTSLDNGYMEVSRSNQSKLQRIWGSTPPGSVAFLADILQ